MTANIADPRRYEIQRRARARRPATEKGDVARQLVREWSPAQRSRIRADLLQFARLARHDFQRCRCEQWGRCLVHCPTCDCVAKSSEMHVVALIDKISAEEA